MSIVYLFSISCLNLKYVFFFFYHYYLYLQVIEIDLNTLEPHVNGPFTPDLAHPISKLGDNAKKNDWPIEIKVGKFFANIMLFITRVLINKKNSKCCCM